MKRTDSALRCLIVSDFNAASLAAFLENGAGLPKIKAVCAAPGPVVPALLEPATFAAGYDLAVVWSSPEASIPAYQSALLLEPFDSDVLSAEVERYADALASAARHVPFVLATSWTPVCPTVSLGLAAYKTGGPRLVLDQMNLQLARRLALEPAVFFVNAGDWAQAAGGSPLNPKAYFHGKIPYRFELFEKAAGELRAAVACLSLAPRKLLVVDLDDTLWGGVVGEVGVGGLRLGGHDAAGEAFVAFQRGLKSLANRGVVLAVLSKNDATVALDAINSHPEMILRESDFSAHRINWCDKAENLVELLEELNLGPESAVFIDDSPAERARVRDALPEVLVPEWPRDKLLYTEALAALRCFEAPSVSPEDRSRTLMYRAERDRRAQRTSFTSVSEWLEDLELRVELRPLDEVNLLRVAQLLSKVNQMNLTSRRLAAADLCKWAAAERHHIWALTVSDKHGSSGLTGVVSYIQEEHEAHIVDFVLSCRVFGREVELVMAHCLAEHAARSGARSLVATYLPTPRNKPCELFWQKRSGFERCGNTFTWDLSKWYPIPAHAELVSSVGKCPSHARRPR